VLQCAAVYYSVHNLFCKLVTQSGAACCSVLQYVAACCSMLQCVAVCYNVLQCFEVYRTCSASWWLNLVPLVAVG